MNRARRGGAYILVLGAATMLTVVGLGTVAVMRTSIARVAAARDWSAAGVLAESAIEGALSRINTETTWRDDFQSSPTSAVCAIGPGTCYFTMRDPGDADLARGSRDPVLIHGVGTVGRARRAYAVQAAYVPPPVLDVLKYGIYASGAIDVRGASTVTGAGTRSGGTLSNSGTLTSDVAASAVANSGTIIGEVREGVAPLSTLSDGSLAGVAAQATAINYSAIPSGAIDSVVLGPGSNPYGSAAANGTYVISVPALSTLRIRRSRIVGTLVVQLGLSSSLEVRDEINWERGPSNLPVLIISATALSSVSLSGSASQLSESSLGVNFNPVSTPFGGQSDLDTADTYPSQVRGIIHISTLLASVTIGSNFNLTGTLITEGSIAIDAGVTVNYDATVLQDPPSAYQTGPATMMPVPGTWSWVPVPN